MGYHSICRFVPGATSPWLAYLVVVLICSSTWLPAQAQEIREWRKKSGDSLMIGKLQKVEGERIQIAPAKGKAGTISIGLKQLSREDQAYIKAFREGTLPKAPEPDPHAGYLLHSVEFMESINGQDMDERYLDGDVEIKAQSRNKLVLARVEFKVNRGDSESVVRLARKRQEIVKELPAFRDWILIDRTALQKYPPEKYRFLDKDLFELVDRKGYAVPPVWAARQNCDSILLIDDELRFSAGRDAPPATREILRTRETYTGLISTSDTLTRLYLLYSVPRRLDVTEASIRIAD